MVRDVAAAAACHEDFGAEFFGAVDCDDWGCVVARGAECACGVDGGHESCGAGADDGDGGFWGGGGSGGHWWDRSLLFVVRDS